MRSSYIIALLLFIPFIIFQLTVVPLISIQGIVPDTLLILLIYFTLREGQLYGTIMGFIFGLLFDIISGGVLGSAAFAKTIAGFIGGYFFTESTEGAENSNIKTYKFALIVLLCSLIDSTIFAFFSGSDFDYSLAVLFLKQGVIPAVYTAVVSNVALLFVSRRASTR
jgi:rod shape-determining protein MreD